MSLQHAETRPGRPGRKPPPGTTRLNELAREIIKKNPSVFVAARGLAAAILAERDFDVLLALIDERELVELCESVVQPLKDHAPSRQPRAPARSAADKPKPANAPRSPAALSVVQQTVEQSLFDMRVAGRKLGAICISELRTIARELGFESRLCLDLAGRLGSADQALTVKAVASEVMVRAAIAAARRETAAA